MQMKREKKWQGKDWPSSHRPAPQRGKQAVCGILCWWLHGGLISWSADTHGACEPTRPFPAREGGGGWRPPLLVAERGRVESVCTYPAFHQFSLWCFHSLKKMMKWSPMGVFHFLNNKDVCFFGDAKRAHFHQRLFPHYTGRVFNIQVGGALKGTNFGNPHLEKQFWIFMVLFIQRSQGITKQNMKSLTTFQGANRRELLTSLGRRENSGQNEGTLRQKITKEPGILCLKLLLLPLKFVCLPWHGLIVIMHKITPLY